MLLGDGKGHLLELSKLAEKDPEFFKYLQENDQELLDFNPDGLEDEDEDMADGETAANQLPILTRDIIQKWQKAILEVRSNSSLGCIVFTLLDIAAAIFARPTEALNSLPLCSTHERG